VSGDPYESGLERNAANYTPLSPLSFLPRAAAVYPRHTAVVHGAQRRDWAETYRRCRRLASALSKRGIGPGDTVAVMAPNTPPLFEAHFGVPVLGAVLNALNTRLDAAAIAFILAHGEAKLLITDTEFAPIIKKALETLGRAIPVIDIDDPEGPGGERLGETDYEAFLEEGDPAHPWPLPEDEWRAISLNYTSGTTGNPKGVVYHHRGAYLNAIGNVLTWGMGPHPVYLWTLPMFHCNGWCFPWTVAAMACAGSRPRRSTGPSRKTA
jgi:fatty-acyl-CoA synthase